jgi:FPC/CPF motif-containing protein YcgG
LETATNPFNDRRAIENSCYGQFDGTRLVLPLRNSVPVGDEAQSTHRQFRDFVLDRDFSCVGGKKAFHDGTYRFGVYGELGSAAASAGLARDLWEFVHERPSMGSHFTTFAACFANPAPADEHEFERLLWAQLQSLHDLDKEHSAWDPSVSSDPEDRNYSFSFAGRGFFVVGLHAGSSRWSRKLSTPALVFNAHEQFEYLRAVGKYESFKRVIRRRELRSQGSINPNLSDFGDVSEARQYSGRHTEEGWKCPFHA